MVKLGIEFESNCVYEILFEPDKLNNLIGAISKCVLPCFCLKSIEKNFLEQASDQLIEEIVTLNSVKNSEVFLQKFLKNNDLKIDSVILPNLVELLIYYNESIILLHKFKSLYNSSTEEENLGRQIK